MTAERVRFAPSPTGHLHVGGARTALFCYLVARHSGGSLVLRIEDTDTERSDPAFEAAILRDLAWLGLYWDEGPDVDGAHGPYRQSERREVYEAAFADLAMRGDVYPCFCTAEVLTADADADRRAHRPPRYAGRCRELSASDAQRRLDGGESAVWRFRVEPGRDIEIPDLVHGEVHFRSDDIADFVVRRIDGSFTFDLAGAVDDARMGVTIAIRGDDHLSNTPRHMLLHKSLEVPSPRYAHLPLVTGVSGGPLSKSQGGSEIRELREAGYLPSAVLNHLALLGWAPPDSDELVTLDEMVGAFELSRVSRSPSVHDLARLRHLGTVHISRLPAATLASLIAEGSSSPGWLDLDALAGAVSGEVATIEEARAIARRLADPHADDEALTLLATPEAQEALRVGSSALAGCASAAESADAVRDALKRAGIPLEVGLPAARAALTGEAHGLRLGDLLALLGLERSRERLAAAVE